MYKIKKYSKKSHWVFSGFPKFTERLNFSIEILLTFIAKRTIIGETFGLVFDVSTGTSSSRNLIYDFEHTLKYSMFLCDLHKLEKINDMIKI